MIDCPADTPNCLKMPREPAQRDLGGGSLSLGASKLPTRRSFLPEMDVNQTFKTSKPQIWKPKLAGTGRDLVEAKGGPLKGLVTIRRSLQSCHCSWSNACLSHKSRVTPTRLLD